MSTQESMEEDVEAVAVDEALDGAHELGHYKNTEQEESPPSQNLPASQQVDVDDLEQAGVNSKPRVASVLLSRNDQSQLKVLRRICQRQNSNFEQASNSFVAWKTLLAQMQSPKSRHPSLIERGILNRALARDSVESMRSALRYRSTPHKMKVRNRILLYTALRRVPEKGAMMLQALLLESSSSYLPFYMIEDTIGFLARRLRQLNLDERQDCAQSLADMIIQACHRGKREHIRPVQNTIYSILGALPPNKLEEWFRQLMRHRVWLHKNTLLQFASRFAKMSATKELSLDIWRDLCETTSFDINTPVGVSFCTSLLSFEDQDLHALDETSPTPAEIFQCLLDLGLIPNAITYTTIIRSLCVKKELETALEVFEVMTRHGVQPDAHTYSVMMNGCKSSGDFDTMVQFAFDARAADIRDPVVWNDIIHATFLACLKERRVPGGRRGPRCMVWGPMNAIFTRFFNPDPLYALITARQTEVREFMELQGVIPTRMKGVFYDLLPLPPKELLQPTSSTLTLMVMGFVRHLPRPYDVILFYDQFKELLRQGHPVAQMLIEEQGSMVHDIVLRALLKWKGTLRLMLEITRDMMPDDTQPETVTTPLSSPTVEPHSSEDLFANLTTDEEVSAVESTIAETEMLITDTAADIEDVGEATTGDGILSNAGPSDAHDYVEEERVPIHHPRPSVHTWSILIKGFMSDDRPEDAEHALELMQAHGVEPNRVTWNTIAAGYARLGDTKQAVEAMRRLEVAGFKSDHFTLRAFSFIRDKYKAVKLMEQTLEQNKLIMMATEQQQEEEAEVAEAARQRNEAKADSLIDRWEQDSRLEDEILKHTYREETPSPGWEPPPAVESGEVSQAQHEEAQKPTAKAPTPPKPNLAAWDDLLWDHAAESEGQDEREQSAA
ncbi:hypothetical protein Daus18300_002098 [Diaporthe australafricana]|uniref:Pentatricopeptide repeat protein n=1 Tax=Diaporthe australafricana TaxID=127596 RepID=A0ABR3XQA4_9PEZI